MNYAAVCPQAGEGVTVRRGQTVLESRICSCLPSRIYMKHWSLYVGAKKYLTLCFAFSELHLEIFNVRLIVQTSVLICLYHQNINLEEVE